MKVFALALDCIHKGTCRRPSLSYLFPALTAIGFFLAGSSSASAGDTFETGVFLSRTSDSSITAFESAVGRHQDIIMYFQSWAGRGAAFNKRQAQAIIDRGSTPMITWEPQDQDGHAVNQPEYSLKNISGGSHDPYIRDFARAAKEIRGDIQIRLMHEMNGDWYPWCGTVNGNRLEDFIPAYRHVVDIFREEGVINVKWVWSPNNAGLPDWGTSSFRDYYPGDSYVDYVGIDGYNWGTTKPWSSWNDFSRIFNEPYQEVLRITNKPIIIAESASTEFGGNKSAWITNTFNQIKGSYSRVIGLVWFENVSGNHWSVSSSDASLQAYRRAMASLPPSTADYEREKLWSETLNSKLITPAISTRVSKNRRFTVGWNMASNYLGSRTVTYDIQTKEGNNGSWRDWRKQTLSTRSRFRGKTGRTHYFRARARARYGLAGPWSRSEKTIVPLDERSRRVRFSKKWKTRIHWASRCFRKTVHYSSRRGAKVKYSFKGHKIFVIGQKGPKNGKAAVYVDGRKVGAFNAYSRRNKLRKVLFSWPKRPMKKAQFHRITIKVLGRKKPVAKGFRVAVDGFAVLR